MMLDDQPNRVTLMRVFVSSSLQKGDAHVLATTQRSTNKRRLSTEIVIHICFFGDQEVDGIGVPISNSIQQGSVAAACTLVDIRAEIQAPLYSLNFTLSHSSNDVSFCIE